MIFLSQNRKMSEKKVYSRKKKIEKNNNRLQIAVAVALVAIIVVVAFIALTGKGKNPAVSALTNDSYNGSGSADESITPEYEDEYIKIMKEYSDVIIPRSNIDDDDYIKETLLVGDSNTEALSNFYYVPLQYVLGYTGMGIQQVTQTKCIYFVGYEEPVTIPTAVGMLKPRRVIINFGTNNAGGMEPEDFVKTYLKVISAIEKSYPYCDIIVESIFPVGKVRNYPKIRQTDIDEMNIALAQMCRDNGYMFLNTAEYLKGDDGFIDTDYISSDGIHLSKEGYTAVLEYINSHKYITKDNRPSRGTIPQRRTAPVVSSSSETVSSSSVASSSSVVSSSSVLSSSIVPSSDVESSIPAYSSSAVELPPSSRAESSNNEPSSKEHVHSYGDWVTVTERGYGTDGLKKRECACGDTQTETIPALTPTPEPEPSADTEPRSDENAEISADTPQE